MVKKTQIITIIILEYVHIKLEILKKLINVLIYLSSIILNRYTGNFYLFLIASFMV